MEETNKYIALYFSGTDFSKTENEKLPKEIAGQPVEYFWKDVISLGNYVHPVFGVNIDVTPERLKHWEEEGNMMLDSGLDIPINTDHDMDARNVFGYVKDFKVEGDKLMTLCQFIGADAPLLAARNKVSVGIKNQFVDGKQREWKDVIFHLALTPDPAVPNQDDFKEVYLFSNSVGALLAVPGEVGALLAVPGEVGASSLASTRERASDVNLGITIQNDIAEENAQGEEIQKEIEGTETTTEEEPIMDNCMSLNCSNETMDGLHKFVPGLKDAADDDKCARILQHLHSLAQADEEDACMDPTTMMSMSVDKIHDKAKENRSVWKKNHVLPLSNDAREAVVENFQTKLDIAMEKGAIDRPTKAKLEELFGCGPNEKNEINTIAFSKSIGKNKSIALALVDILMSNRPIEMKEKSGVQMLQSSLTGNTAQLAEMIKESAKRVGINK